MKKLNTLCLFAALLVTGCGDNSSTSPSQTVAPDPPAAAPALVFDATWVVSNDTPEAALAITLRFTGTMGASIDQLTVHYECTEFAIAGCRDGATANFGAGWFINNPFIGRNHFNGGEEIRFRATAPFARVTERAVAAVIQFTDDSGEQWLLAWER